MQKQNMQTHKNSQTPTEKNKLYIQEFSFLVILYIFLSAIINWHDLPLKSCDVQ